MNLQRVFLDSRALNKAKFIFADGKKKSLILSGFRVFIGGCFRNNNYKFLLLFFQIDLRLN